MSDEMNSAAAPQGYKSIDPEADAWSERERERYAAWLAGPSEREKALVKSKLLARAARMSDDASFDAALVDAQVEGWAVQERASRLAWAEQPSQRGLDALDSADRVALSAMGARALSTADLAVRGLWHRIATYSLVYVDSLVVEGRRSARRVPLRKGVDFF